jgi:hypothetical protein
VTYEHEGSYSAGIRLSAQSRQPERRLSKPGLRVQKKMNMPSNPGKKWLDYLFVAMILASLAVLLHELLQK